MHAEDRIIHFTTELIHKPKARDKQALQKLYYTLSKDHVAAYDSSDFSQPQQARFQSKRGPRTQSLMLVLPDRFLIVEEWADMSLADYVSMVKAVATCSMAELDTGPILAHTVTIRSTSVLTHFTDSLRFLMDQVFHQTDRIEPHFQRPMTTGGLRFVFRETPESPGDLHAIIESFQHNTNEVFVEVKAIHKTQKFDLDGVDVLESSIHSCRQFISDSIYPFLNQYDTPQVDHA